MNIRHWTNRASLTNFRIHGLLRKSLSASVSLCVIIGAAPSFAQTTYHVDAANCPAPGTGTPADAFCLIQSGVDAAVAGDTVLVAPGTYPEVVLIFEKAITLRSTDGADVTTIQGDQDTVVWTLNTEDPIVVDGFTITNGRHAIGVFLARPLITNCRIVDNNGPFDEGAGILIHQDSDVTITNCLFLRNFAPDFDGGAIFMKDSSATVSNCIFQENHARGGAAIYTKGTGNLTVTNSLFERNTVQDFGAGIRATSTGTTTLLNCMFRENVAPSSGGALVFSSDNHVDAINCAMINNISGSGAIHNTGGTGQFVNCTIAGNTATTNTAGYNGGNSGSNALGNCVLWGNSLNGSTDQAAQVGGTVSFQYSVIEGWDGMLPGFQTDGNDPLLRNLANSDVRLSPGSPSIDAARNGALPPTVTTDLDDNTRRVDDPTVIDTGAGSAPIVDKGAYEFGDCNNNGVFDGDDVTAGTSADCNGNAVPDECEIDCNDNGIADSCDVTSGTSEDIDGNGTPDECDPDCNGNGVPDGHEITTGLSDDCDRNGVPDDCKNGCNECDFDCNQNGVSDACDVTYGSSTDCNGNDIPDDCDLAEGVSEDCNQDALPDECGIAAGTSDDCNANAVPDECEPDCNLNGVADSCDIDAGTSDDCAGNGIPDDCEPDCNANGTADACDIADENSIDCNQDGVPDECDLPLDVSEDCNGNSVLDECEPDCNDNGIPNECDIAAGTSDDLNGDGVPDECQCPPSPPAFEPLLTPKNRFLSLGKSNAGQQIARRVTFVDLPPPFDVWNGSELWVGPTATVSEAGSSVAPLAGFDNFNAATLQCTPFYANWDGLGTVHVFHEGIVPSGTYRIDAIDDSCDPSDPASFSDAIVQTCAIWGDTVLDLTETPPLPPDRAINIVDTLAVLGRFASAPDSIIKARADLVPGCPNLVIGTADLLATLSAFVGLDYRFVPTADDPCDSTCVNPLSALVP